MITENLSTLKIHKLTQEQYDRALANGSIDENALYFTPDEEIDLSPYATNEEVSTIYETKVDANDKLIEAQTYTNTKVANLTSATVVDNKISAHNTSTSAHNDIRALITDLTTKLNNFLDIDDTTTDQLSEVLTLIENNKGTLESLTTSKINVSDIVNNLTTASASKVLSAQQGVAIKTLIDNLQAVIDDKANVGHTHTIANVTDLQTTLDGKSDTSHTHNNIVSRGNVAAETETTRPSVDGLSMSQAFNNGYPSNYGNVLNLKGNGDGQIFVGWSNVSGANAPLYVRSRRNVSAAPWSEWAQIYTTVHKPTLADIGAAADSHTHTELNYLDGVTSNIQAQLNERTQRIKLTGQVQTNSYVTSVIALCLAPQTQTTLNSYSVGRLTFQRKNASIAPMVADVVFAAGWGVNKIQARITRTSNFNTFRPCIFTYNGVTYGGVEVITNASEMTEVVFDGVTTFDVFGLDIYRSNTSTVLNEEVYNSISYDTITIINGWQDGDYKFITEQNIGSQSVSHATSADSATSSTKAAQDGNGNVITNTYATKVEVDTAVDNISLSSLGVNATATELNYVDGVTSNIQTQLDSKLSTTDTAAKATADANGNIIHNTYMTRNHPDATGSFSLNRKIDTAVGQNSVAIGWDTTANGIGSNAMGHQSTASGDFSTAIGENATSIGAYSFAGGCSTAEGIGSIAMGWGARAAGDYSFAGGYSTYALANQHTQGHYNDTSKATAGDESGAGNGTAFVIGNGTESTRANAFRVTYAGKPYAKSTLTTTGADYAEFFEWQDSNPNNEDRRGYFVTIDEDKIKIAKPNDYILGIISGQPSVAGNGDEDWMGRYILDEFGAFIYEDFEYEVKIPENIQEEVIDEETGKVTVVTNTVMKTVKKTGKKYKENPDYDPTRPYIQREDRPEWDYVGLLGVLSVRDDGTCKVNGYCKVAEGGIATASETGYRVIKRVSDNVVKVIFR